MKSSALYLSIAYMAALALFCSPPLAYGASPTKTPPPASQPSAPNDTERERPAAARDDQSEEQTAVIAPYRSAEIAAEARGLVESFHFKEGDFVEKDQVVVVISKKRYTLAVQRATNAVKAAETDQKRARQEAQLKEQLLSEKAVTHADVLKAKTDEEITQYRLEDAKNALEVARMDLEACQVKAPFSGFLALRFKEPYESVDYSQKLFVIVDTSKVYAIAGVPESYLSYFAKGRRAAFITASGKAQKFVGTVERIGKLLDSKSWTKKVYVVIDNPDNKLEVGMTGSLEPAK